MAITRRSFLAGLGSVSIGLLFRRQLDRVLASLEQDLIDDPAAPDQIPAAAEIVVQADSEFRPKRLVVPLDIAPRFVIEDIRVGKLSQIAGGSIPAGVFSADCPEPVDLMLSTAGPGIEMCFRVRYIGSDPRGERFRAALIGTDANGRWGKVLPIDSVDAIAA